MKHKDIVKALENEGWKVSQRIVKTVFGNDQERFECSNNKNIVFWFINSVRDLTCVTVENIEERKNSLYEHTTGNTAHTTKKLVELMKQ
jgi:hypothetical protein